MIKKYFDKNNYLVGITYGEITENSKDTDYDHAQQIMSLLEGKPNRKGYKTHLLDSSDENIYAYDYVYERIPESEWSDELLKEMFQEQIMSSISVSNKPAAKEGYSLKPILTGTTISWEFVKDGDPSEDEDVTKGTYINPITYVNGMEVKITKWYTDGDNIWEAIASGIPTGFDDKNYFDIIS